MKITASLLTSAALLLAGSAFAANPASTTVHTNQHATTSSTQQMHASDMHAHAAKMHRHNAKLHQQAADMHEHHAKMMKKTSTGNNAQ